MKCKSCQKRKAASAGGFCKQCDPAPKGTFKKTVTGSVRSTVTPATVN